LYAEEILSKERLNPLSNLSNSESDGYKLIKNTIGWFLDEKNDAELINQIFISTATGEYLDLIGNTYGVTRKTDETDEDYRNRILLIVNFVFSPNYLHKLGVEIFCYVEEIENQITSSNPLLSHQYLLYADNDTQKTVERFINTNTYEWLEEL